MCEQCDPPTTLHPTPVEVEIPSECSACGGESDDLMPSRQSRVGQEDSGRIVFYCPYCYEAATAVDAYLTYGGMLSPEVELELRLSRYMNVLERRLREAARG